MPGEQFDAYDTPEPAPSARPPRPFVGIRFECCSVYSRIYQNATGDAYEGRCPRCMRSVRLRIGAGGVSSRFFTAY